MAASGTSDDSYGQPRAGDVASIESCRVQDSGLNLSFFGVYPRGQKARARHHGTRERAATDFVDSERKLEGARELESGRRTYMYM